MARTSKQETEPRRLNRTVPVSDALSGVLGSALRKRGFATRDLITHWAAMAPKPYDALAVPAELKWPRGAGHEGATLYVRCAPGHALALAHESGLIAAAINRYFGYFLVREVKLSAEPFTAPAPGPVRDLPPPPEAARKAGEAVAPVEDEGLREALRALGQRVLANKP